MEVKRLLVSKFHKMCDRGSLGYIPQIKDLVEHKLHIFIMACPFSRIQNILFSGVFILYFVNTTLNLPDDGLLN